MIKNKNLIITIFTLFVLMLQAQAQVDSTKIKIDSLLSDKDYIMYKSTDSIPVLDLDSVYILPKIRFNNYKELKHYLQGRK